MKVHPRPRRTLLAALPLLALLPLSPAVHPAPSAAQIRRMAPPPVGTVVLDSDRVELPLDLSTRRPMVRVTVAGHGPYWFVFDTGSGANVIDAALAQELGLTSVGVQRVGSPGGTPIDAHRYAISSLAAGDLHIADTEALGIDLASMAGDTFQGIIGLRNFSDYLVTFDYPREALVIETGSLTEGDAGTVRYQSGGRLLRLDIEVAGVTLPADLDTGSPRSFMLPKAFEDRWSYLSPVTEAGTARLVGAEHPVWRARLEGVIEIAGHTFENPEVGLAEFTSDFANIGYEVLRDMAVTIDQAAGLVRLVRSDTPGDR